MIRQLQENTFHRRESAGASFVWKILFPFYQTMDDSFQTEWNRISPLEDEAQLSSAVSAIVTIRP